MFVVCAVGSLGTGMSQHWLCGMVQCYRLEGGRTPEFPRQHCECVSECGVKLKPLRLRSDEGWSRMSWLQSDTNELNTSTNVLSVMADLFHYKKIGH